MPTPATEGRECGLDRTNPSHGWIWERWKSLTPREAAEFESDVGRPPACEVCTANARNVGS